jgi:hypothetical protein
MLRLMKQCDRIDIKGEVLLVQLEMALAELRAWNADQTCMCEQPPDEIASTSNPRARMRVTDVMTEAALGIIVRDLDDAILAAVGLQRQPAQSVAHNEVRTE